MPFATLIRFIGGEVSREPGKVTLDVDGKKGVFTEGSSLVQTDKGEVDLGAKVFRGNAGQLYMPVDGSCKVFGMQWAYAARNNFITVECSNESRPVPNQP